MERRRCGTTLSFDRTVAPFAHRPACFRLAGMQSKHVAFRRMAFVKGPEYWVIPGKQGR